MPISFYPNPEDVDKGSTDDRIEVLRNAAESYMAVVHDVGIRADHDGGEIAPKDLTAAFYWEELVAVLTKVRAMSEATHEEKANKAKMLNQLAEIYEVLRSAKMPKLEAVRLAIVSEAKQLE